MMFFSPLLFTIVYYTLLIFFYYFYNFIDFELIKPDFGTSFIVYSMFLYTILGTASAKIIWKVFSYTKIGREHTILYDVRLIHKFANYLLVIGIFSTVIKLSIVLIKYGTPNFSNLFIYFTQVRLEYLAGNLQIPIILIILKQSLFVSLILYSVLVFLFRKKLTTKIVLTLTFLLLDDLSTGGRGYIFFAFILCFSIYIYAIKFRFIRFGLKEVMVISLLFMLIFTYIISIPMAREGLEGFEGFLRALDSIILYIVGPISATSYLIEEQQVNILPKYMGFYTLNGILRLVLPPSVFNLESLDFGYVPIYKNLDLGFNSFTAVSYLFSDFGYIFASIYTFLLGFFLEVFYQKTKSRFSLENFLFFISIFVIIVFYVRDIATKWVSWWMIIVSILIFYRSRLNHENTKHK